MTGKGPTRVQFLSTGERKTVNKQPNRGPRSSKCGEEKHSGSELEREGSTVLNGVILEGLTEQVVG